MLERGGAVPHFDVATLHGGRASYSAIWQQKMLLLVALPAGDSASARTYVSTLTGQRHMLDACDVECVVTRDRVAGVAPPAVVIADRWGEVAFAVEKADAADLPPPRELADWLEFLRSKCPECEGEAR